MMGVVTAAEMISPKIGEKTDHGTIIVYDSAGREVEIPDTITRVVSLNSNVPEMMLALKADSLLVGIDQGTINNVYTVIPPSLKQLPSVGTEAEPNFEKIAELDPDVVITWANWPMLPDDLQKKLDPFGIPVIGIELYQVETMDEEITFLGEILNRKTEAESLNQFHIDNQAEIVARLGSISDDDKKTVYYEGKKKYQTYGGGGYGCGMPGMISAAEGKDIYPDRTEQAFDADPEDVSKRNPQYIFKGTDPIYNMSVTEGDKLLKETYDEIIAREELQSTDAVKDNHVYVVPFDITAGLRKPFGPLYLAKLLYPEKMEGYDPEAAYNTYLVKYLGLSEQKNTLYPGFPGN